MRLEPPGEQFGLRIPIEVVVEDLEDVGMGPGLRAAGHELDQRSVKGIHALVPGLLSLARDEAVEQGKRGINIIAFVYNETV